MDSQREEGGPQGQEEQPRASRLSHFAACAPCRKRKLRCDGVEPVCGTCLKASRQCLYQDIRKGVRKQRTSIKVLEARLAELESRGSPRNERITKSSVQHIEKIPDRSAIEETTFPVNTRNGLHTTDDFDVSYDEPSLGRDASSSTKPFSFENHQSDGSSYPYDVPGLQYDISSSSFTGQSPVCGDLVTQGLEEPLPLMEAQDELNAIYFSSLYPSMPAIHPARYLAACSLPSTSRLRPPHCLCYAIWALSALTSETYRPFHDIFYRRARKYADLDEMKGWGEVSMSVAHIQTWILIGVYEQTNMQFARGWISARKATSLAFATGLHKLDGVGLAVSNYASPTTDWIELEQRRRTFWLSFIQDKFLSTGSGLPVAVDERDVQTNLPMLDENYENGIIGRNMTLAEAMTPAGARGASTFCATAVVACLSGRIVTVLHRPESDDSSVDDLNNQFWTNYRKIDKILMNAVLRFPEFAATSRVATAPHVVFLNLFIQSCTITLHQAAIFTAGKNPRLAEMRTETKTRCLSAAQSIVSLAHEVSEEVLLRMGPYTPFCLYMAARAFLLVLREGPHDQADEHRNSLRFLMSRMHLLKKTRPYTEALILQLDVDLETLQDTNPTGHLTALNQVEELASAKQSSGQSPLSSVIYPSSSSSNHPPQMHPSIGGTPTSDFQQQARPQVTSRMTYGPTPTQQPTSFPQDYSDSGSNFLSEFVSSNTADRIRPSSMPPDHSDWSQTSNLGFLINSTSQSMGGFIRVTSMPMHDNLDMYDAAMYEQMGDPNGVMNQSTAEWNASLSWDYA